MNEDEAFIRAIQAAPRDRLPRLVYADWLDERGDPRAEFLRLQCGMLASLERLIELHHSLPEQWTRQVDLSYHTFVLYRMPPLGEVIESATILEVLVRPFQNIPKDHGWLTIETEKAIFTLAIEFGCVLVALLAEVGQPIPIGSPFALLLRV